MRPSSRFLHPLLLALVCACGRTTSPARTDAGAARTVVVHVPGALRVARGLDTLSVEIDPASRADADVAVDPAMTLGVEYSTKVFAQGHEDAARERHGFASGTDFDVGTSIWNASQDGAPRPDQRYVAEMTLVLFQTNVAPGHDWNPHAGRFEPLLTRTIRQAEE